MELGIAIVAVLVSVISFAVNLRASSSAERHGRMPVLILQSVLDQSGSRGMVGVRNIGSGPALNIVIATATGALATSDAQRIRVYPRWQARRRHRGDWTGHRHLHPIAVGAERWYRWDHAQRAQLSRASNYGLIVARTVSNLSVSPRSGIASAIHDELMCCCSLI